MKDGIRALFKRLTNSVSSLFRRLQEIGPTLFLPYPTSREISIPTPHIFVPKKGFVSGSGKSAKYIHSLPAKKHIRSGRLGLYADGVFIDWDSGGLYIIDDGQDQSIDLPASTKD